MRNQQLEIRQLPADGVEREGVVIPQAGDQELATRINDLCALWDLQLLADGGDTVSADEHRHAGPGILASHIEHRDVANRDGRRGLGRGVCPQRQEKQERNDCSRRGSKVRSHIRFYSQRLAPVERAYGAIVHPERFHLEKVQRWV